jgi:single-stranded DNA-binding protein
MPEKPIPFDQQKAENVLSALSARIDDAKFGQGDLLMTPVGQTIEVFSDAVRLTGPDFKVEITGHPLIGEVGSDWVGFRGTADGMTRFVAVRTNGDVIFRKSAHPEVQRAEQAQAEATTAALPDPDTTAAAQPGRGAPGPQEPSEALSPASQEAGSEATPERGTPIEFTGRIGRDPLVSKREGKPRVKMAIAEHRQADDGTEETTWHEVWASDKIAAKLADQVEQHTLAQGVEVAVKGYQHERKPDGKGRPGKPFVRAFMVSPIKKR